MDSRNNDNYAELPSVETPEDVAVLYSWANLHGAKYRDFSASRREYRAQLRHRAADQVRDLVAPAQAEADPSADWAEEQTRQSGQTPETEQSLQPEHARHSEQIQGPDEYARNSPDPDDEAAVIIQPASAEHLQALRRAEAAALAETAARSARRKFPEVQSPDRRNTASLADPEPRRRASDFNQELPDRISAASTPATYTPARIDQPEPPSGPALGPRPQRLRIERPAPIAPAALAQIDRTASPTPPAEPVTAPKSRRPQGYRPDDASGVRQIYRGPDTPFTPAKAPRQITPVASTRLPAPQAPPPARPAILAPPTPMQQNTSATDPFAPYNDSAGSRPSSDHPDRDNPAGRDTPEPARTWTAGPAAAPNTSPLPLSSSGSPESGLAGEPAGATPRRRRQDQPGYDLTDSDHAIAAYRREQGSTPDLPRPSARPAQAPWPEAPPTPPRAPEPAVPAWLHEQSADLPPAPVSPRLAAAPDLAASTSPASPLPAADTLQRSRERVASRWYALKGVFEQPGQERGEAQPVRQKETRTPVLAVFSFAGGVGKTSLVATLGRSLSSLGEKVLLTDTTSHGLLPFYFGASELREGTVRTFSPPSGSTDAPIYLVNYAVDQISGQSADDHAQEHVVEEIIRGGRGAHRILLDLASNTGWLIRRMAHLNPTVLVPLAPDMNSVISLQAIEKFLQGIASPEGVPVQVSYLLNQFDASLPLHLDVREVLRRQLGERLLPFVIRRAPAVSEALAEGMTIVDYAADAPAAEDYMNVASWLRTIAAPATAGFRNVRWSER